MGSQNNSLIALDSENLRRFKPFATKHSFKKNEFVFQAGTVKKNFFILLTGYIKLYRVSPQGREVTQWFCFPGEAFGLSELQSKTQQSIYAQCNKDCDVLSIPLNKFNLLLQQSPDIAIQIIEQLSNRLKVAGDTLLNITSDDVKTRLIKLIMRLTMCFGTKSQNGHLLGMPLTHKELADMIGACRQSVTTVIGELKTEGYIEIINHQFLIKKFNEFERLAFEPVTPVSPKKKKAVVS